MITLCAVVLAATILPFGPQGTIRPVSLNGREQKLHVYGDASGPPVILTSGDGGWLGLAPHVADALAAHGYFVVGLDAKAYLSSGTSYRGALSLTDIARDFGTLLSMFAGDQPAILAGISEGAGLTLVAAADTQHRANIRGVVTYGLGERNELAWRWRDSIIYITKKVPPEPTFKASEFIPRVSPVPLAFIRSTHDEFVSNAESDRLIAAAGVPAKAWTVAARNHGFSDNHADLDQATLQAIDWIVAIRSQPHP
jgi:pimeloyl-ACP methyl ester carboxylesterase